MELEITLIQNIFNLRLKYGKVIMDSSKWREISKELDIDNSKEIYHNAIKAYKNSNSYQDIFNNYLNIVNFDYCVENYQKVCRFCLLIKEDFLDITEDPGSHVLNFIHDSSLSNDLKIYDQICTDCFGTIQKFYEFKRNCSDNFKLLVDVKDKVELIRTSGFMSEDSNIDPVESKKSPLKSNGTMCSVCGKLVKGIHMHMLIHKGIKKFQCEYCTKSFTQSGQLKRHINSHLNIRNYSCPHPGCDKTFVDPSSVSKHLVIHNKDERPFVCSICAASFNRLGALRYHEKTHRQERNHKCNVCGKSFLAKYDLTKHFRTHSGEKPYGCNYCDKRFSISKNAKVHQRVHTKERPFQCSYCEMRFSYRSSLRQHENKFHKNLEDQRINIENNTDVVEEFLETENE